MVACSPQGSSDISSAIQEIQKNNIDDKRLSYWKVEVVNSGNKTALRGSVVSRKAYIELQAFADRNNLEFDVELLPGERFEEAPWAIVTLSVCNIRGAARHSAELVTQAVMGTPVKVYKEDDGWFLVQTPDRYFGWVDGAGIGLKSNSEMKRWKELEKVLYRKQNGFAFENADDKSDIEFDLILADLLSVVDNENGYYKVELADGREGFVKTDECVSLEIWKKKSVSPEGVLTTAFRFKGVPYLWGGTSAKMVDCSGFVKSSFYYHGMILQRDASQQTFYGELVDTDNGYETLKKGDLVFFGSKASDDKKERVTHVGMCIGNQEFIHASGKVRINSLYRESDKYTEYYEKAFVRARRVINHVDGSGIEWVVDNKFYKEILPE